MNQTIEIVIAICKAMSMYVPRHAYRPNKTIITLPPRARTLYYRPCQISSHEFFHWYNDRILQLEAKGLEFCDGKIVPKAADS